MVIKSDNQTKINKALNISITKQMPVHINVPFTEPLYDLTDTMLVATTNILPKFNNSKVNRINSFTKKWQNSIKKIILIGVSSPGLFILFNCINSSLLVLKYITFSQNSLHFGKVFLNHSLSLFISIF